MTEKEFTMDDVIEASQENRVQTIQCSNYCFV